MQRELAENLSPRGQEIKAIAMRTILIVQTLIILSFALFALFVAEIGLKAAIFYGLSVAVIMIVFVVAAIFPKDQLSE